MGFGSTVAIVDYGLCNLDSVRRAIEECGGNPVVADHPEAVLQADRIVLPGVGAFPDAMRNLRARSLDAALAERVLADGVPFLGICLGMQMLATTGLEGEETAGLGWIEGVVQRLQPAEAGERIPHIGWNEVHPLQDTPLFRGVAPGQDFYFVHSYHLVPHDSPAALARTPYAGGFVSAVSHDRIFGVQFHPEKSQQAGFRVLRNFLELS